MAEKELAKGYEPHDVEKKWYAVWEREGYFRAAATSDREPYSIVIPPPNMTGVLHMGHALNNTLQDILCRWKRMSGCNVLWMPGTDHAGIATQNVVERQLAAEGKDRHALGREAFIERVWQWKEESGGQIIGQLKRLGASCDWERERFTMDEGLSRAVREVFVRLYEEGLIYRDNRLINWCPRCHTALSDIEVEHEEKTGHLWHLRYPVIGSDRFLVVATTRPETMLGDTAVAVNPADERYRDLIGGHVLLPLVNRKIPIIADDYVDMEFGTGVVKITPAHDFNDFEVGKRHGLDRINIFDESGVMNAAGHQYEGLDRFAARKKIVADLEEQGLLEKIEDHPLAVGGCYRCKTVVEPYLSLQWYVKVAPLAEPAMAAVRERTDPDRSPAVGEYLLRLDGEHPRLVHLPADLVGAPDSRLVLRPLRRNHGGQGRTRPPAPPAAATRSGRRPTCSTPGSPRPSGPSPPWAGRTGPRSCRPSIPPPASSPASTSSFSGWRG